MGVLSALLVTSASTSDRHVSFAFGLVAIGLACVAVLVTRMRSLGIALAGVLSLAPLVWAAWVDDPGEGEYVAAVLALFAVAPAAWLLAATAWARWFPTASANMRSLPWSWPVLLASGVALARALVH